MLNFNSFLTFGYFLDYYNPKYKFSFTGINKEKLLQYSENELMKKWTQLFINSIAKNYEKNKKNLVPLSGGLDSRAILCGLLQFTEAKNIATYTFGTPNTFDYDIGNQISKKIGTKHKNFPLTEYQYNMDELIDISLRTDRQTMLFLHPPVKKIDEFFDGYVVWSGFMGDPASGSHRVDQASISIQEAKKYFLNKEIRAHSMNLSEYRLNDFISFLNIPFVDRNIISYEEQLDFQIRQTKFIAPHVMFKGFQYKTPFIENEYLNFMLNLPGYYRKNQYFYKKVLIKSFPKFFQMPTKTNFGLQLDASNIRSLLNKAIHKIKKKGFYKINPELNYIDFKNAIIFRKDLNKIFYDNLMDLKKRKLIDYIDIDSIWAKHINNNIDHSDILIILVSLEIHLKAGKKY